MKKKYWAIIILLGVIGSVARLYRLDLAPPHLSNDEISIAYDAYSLARTGRDEHGNWWPMAFQSHSTYKAPLYAYILAPLTLVLPNSEQTARLPSAMLGIATFLVFGLLAAEICGSKEIGIIALALMCLSPWHIYTSRMALESNVALFFLTGGIWLWLRNSPFWAIIFLALSIYGYHTEWLLAPLIVLGLWWFKDKKNKKYFSYFGLLVLLCLPIGLNFVKNLRTSARANTEMVWKNPVLEAQLKDPKVPFLNKPVLIAKNIFSNYLEYWDLNYLFFDGLRILPARNVFQIGLMLVCLLPFLLLGMIKGKKLIKLEYRSFVWFWLLITPMVPAMTQGGTNLVRDLPSVMPLLLICTIGIYWTIQNSKYWLKIIIFLVFLINSGYFIAIYYNHFPKQSGLGYQYGYKQIETAIEPVKADYERIVVETRFGDNKRFVGVPHLYLAYFGNVDPNQMLKRRDTPNGLFFDKYIIKEINWENEVILPETIYAVPVSNLPPAKIDNLTVYYNIMQTDGIEAFRIYVSGN